MLIRSLFNSCRTVLLATAMFGTAVSLPQSRQLDPYPPTERVETVESLHGIQIRDPYRWLEDLDSHEVQQWMKEQDRLAATFLESNPRFKPLQDRIQSMLNFARYLTLHPDRTSASCGSASGADTISYAFARGSARRAGYHKTGTPVERGICPISKPLNIQRIDFGGGGSRTPVRKALPPEDYMRSPFACGPILADPPQFASRA